MCGGGANPKPQPAAPGSPPVAAKAAPGGSELLAGLGDHHHPINTSNPEAQKFFDQGMDLTFGLNHEAAIRSFDRAHELDPKAAMPLWGKAWALGTNYNMPVDDAREQQAFDTIAQAKALAAEGAAKAAPFNEMERDYVNAMAQRYSADMKADRQALERKYSAAMGELSRKYPDDLDAATLYAESMMNLNPWKLWSADGKPAPGTEHIVDVLESVLRREPNHLAANHFYIRSGGITKPGARAAKRDEVGDGGSGIGTHRPHAGAHLRAHRRSLRLRARQRRWGRCRRKVSCHRAAESMYGLMYYSHNLQFLSDANMMQGRFVDAQRAAQVLAKRLDGNPHAAMFPHGGFRHRRAHLRASPVQQE